ncbi:MAG: T9SS type A sorting domain-containing protein, partial [Flavobacteriales bacterium]|nr:T9SS type A sorting domain-containing protein [Flavobacteriales bacterium]
QVNGINAGTNSASFSSTALNDANAVTCIMTSSLSCVTGSPDTSSAITITVTSTTVPAHTIVLSSGTNPMCAGESVSFTALPPINGGSTPAYQWQVDGGNVGTSITTYTSSTFTDGQVVTCVLTSSSGCANPSTATSNGIPLTVNAIPATPTIFENGLVLMSSATAGNVWYLDGTAIPGAIGQTYTVIQDGAYTVVVTEDGCSSAASVASNITITGIAEVSHDFYFNIYPNPSEGDVNISFNTIANSTYNLELRNVLGQLIYQETVADFQGQFYKQMNVSQHGTGMYVISLTNSKNKTKISRIFIQR